MKIVHTTMAYCDEHGALYMAAVLNARWVNRAEGRWSARFLEEVDSDLADMPTRITIGKHVSSSERCALRDAHSREVARRIGLPAGPDTFPWR